MPPCTFIQLWNGAAGRALYLQAITIGSSAADIWGVGICQNILNSTSPNVPVNNNPAGPASVVQLRTDSANQTLTGSKTIKIGYVTSTTDRIVLFPRPLLIPTGYGVYCYLGSNANTLRASFEYEEWPA